MASVPFTTSTMQEILSKSWKTLLDNIVFFILLIVAFALIEIAIAILDGIIGRAFINSTGLTLIALVVEELISLCVGTAIAIEYVGAGLRMVRGEKLDIMSYQWKFLSPDYSTLFITYLLANILVGIIVGVGFILLIVPGIILGLMFMFTQMSIIDKRLGVIDAMKRSMEITDGNKVKIFLFLLVIIAINIIGCIPFFLGLIVTVPLSYFSVLYMYLYLSESSVNTHTTQENSTETIDKPEGIN